jgi:GTPase SAR1 family protein
MKFVMLGSPGAGKTSIVNRFVDNEYSEDPLATIGADLKSVTLCLDNVLIRL